VESLGKILRPGGVVIMHDFTYPGQRVFARMWDLYLLLLRTIGPCLYPAWKNAFEGLPSLVRETDWVERLLGLLAAGGFVEGTVETLFLGTSAIVSAKKR